MIVAVIFAYVPLAIWLYLLLGRGFYWRARERDDNDDFPRPLEHWPSVVAVVPARNEAEVITQSLGSLLRQDYPGPFRIILVDDESDDGTAEIARGLDHQNRLTIISGTKPPALWTGKLWASAQGTAHAAKTEPDYLWLTDADILHAPDNLRRLVAHAEKRRLVLVSLMAKLRCESLAERAFIPAFVYFFQMLYPFRWVNGPRSKTAAAAGGCMLIKRAALETAGGISAIRSEIIDDCALGRLLKAHGPIWLGLTTRAVSLRPYPRVDDIRRMVARSAYAELDYSPLLLGCTLAGLVLTFLLPPLWSIFGAGASRVAAIIAWMLMTLSFQPMLRFYGRSPLWGVALPLAGLAYAAFTFDSAVQYWRGRGGTWKGRYQATAHR
jgi:hopene-associated glycosyltransferase HpnB